MCECARVLHAAVLENTFRDGEARGCPQQVVGQRARAILLKVRPAESAEDVRLGARPRRMRSAFLALDLGARSERRPRSEGLAARRWPFRSASSTLVSGMALGVLHVGWNNSLHISWDIESRFANVLVCAGLFAQECKTSGFADLLSPKEANRRPKHQKNST